MQGEQRHDTRVLPLLLSPWVPALPSGLAWARHFHTSAEVPCACSEVSTHAGGRCGRAEAYVVVRRDRFSGFIGTQTRSAPAWVRPQPAQEHISPLLQEVAPGHSPPSSPSSFLVLHVPDVTLTRGPHLQPSCLLRFCFVSCPSPSLPRSFKQSRGHPLLLGALQLLLN